MNQFYLIALWCWFRNKPDADFDEFMDAYKRARRLFPRGIDEQNH